jgi:hypothetical protein
MIVARMQVRPVSDSGERPRVSMKIAQGGLLRLVTMALAAAMVSG